MELLRISKTCRWKRYDLLMGKLLFQFNGIKRILFVLFLMTITQGAFILLQAKWLAGAISSLFASKTVWDVRMEIVLFFGAFVTRHALTLIRQRVVYRYAKRTTTDLKESVLTKLFELGPRFTKKEGTGNAVTLVMEGVPQVQSYLELFLPKFMNMMVLPLMIGLFIFTTDRTSAVILAVTLPILLLFMVLLGLAAKKKADRQWSSYRLLSNHFVDSLRGLETLTFLGLSKSHEQQIAAVSDRYKKATMSTLRIAFLSSFALDFFSMLAVATVAVFLGLGLINGHLELYPALLTLILAPEFFLPVREVGTDYHATLNGQEAGMTMMNILQQPGFVKENAVKRVWSDHSSMELRHVTVQHEESVVPSLQDLTLTLKGKKTIGIIGESGSGKSTLIELLGGFLQASSGKIVINGTELTHLQQDGWQQQLLYIPQHPYVFNDTLLNNLRFYTPDATMEEVERAVQAVGLDKVVRELPNGLQEKIGEGGRALSGGQSQRVALARAFLENRPVLLLDEPTAHLDIETEYELKGKMLPLFQDKLVLLATHRLHWMRQMDEIIVLHKGKVVEVGCHDELIKKRGFYYDLVQAQMEAV